MTYLTKPEHRRGRRPYSAAEGAPVAMRTMNPARDLEHAARHDPYSPTDPDHQHPTRPGTRTRVTHATPQPYADEVY
jgi:hypothetical protein